MSQYKYSILEQISESDKDSLAFAKEKNVSDINCPVGKSGKSMQLNIPKDNL